MERGGGGVARRLTLIVAMIYGQLANGWQMVPEIPACSRQHGN
jgi:hypothetical protein